MKPQRLIIQEDPVKEEMLKVLNNIKVGFYFSKQALCDEFGIAQGGLELRLRKYPDLRKYLCYIKRSKYNRFAVFVNPKYRAELIKKKLATEKY